MIGFIIGPVEREEGKRFGIQCPTDSVEQIALAAVDLTGRPGWGRWNSALPAAGTKNKSSVQVVFSYV